MKYLIVYHAHCIDGITAATVTTKFLLEKKQAAQEDITLMPMSYEDGLDYLSSALVTKEIDALYIVDFSFTRETLYALNEVVPVIELYDHHASAFKNLLGAEYKLTPLSWENYWLPALDPESELSSDIHIVLDMDECGASLCYKNLLQDSPSLDDTLPKLIRFVKDYDLYRFTDSNTKAVNKYLKQRSKDLATYTALLIALEDDYFLTPAIREGRVLIEYEEQLEASIIDSCKTPITIEGIEGLCCNAPYALASSIGNKLANLSGTFGATWVQKAEGVVSFSLRSIGDSCDVSSLAELFGGGGHKNASGLSMKSPNYDTKKGITLMAEHPATVAPKEDSATNG